MEENNSRNADENAQEAAVYTQENRGRHHNHCGRKNRRNRNPHSASKKGSEAAVCGEIENSGETREKLSGSHVSGYEGGDIPAEENSEFSGERRPRFDRGERRDGRKFRQDRQDSENSECEEDSERQSGPSFEEPEAKSRAVEVSLHDRRQKDFKKDKASYEAAAQKPKGGIFSKIKALFKSVFGEKKKTEHKNKDGRRRDWKNGRREQRKDWKQGERKHRQNDRRRHGDRHGHNKHHGRRHDNPHKSPDSE